MILQISFTLNFFKKSNIIKLSSMTHFSTVDLIRLISKSRANATCLHRVFTGTKEQTSDIFHVFL